MFVSFWFPSKGAGITAQLAEHIPRRHHGMCPISSLKRRQKQGTGFLVDFGGKKGNSAFYGSSSNSQPCIFLRIVYISCDLLPQYLPSLHAGWWASIINSSHVQCPQGIHLAPGNYGNRNGIHVLKRHSVYTVQLKQKQNGKTEDLENITSWFSCGPACHVSNSSGQNWLLLDINSICWNFLNHQHWLC